MKPIITGRLIMPKRFKFNSNPVHWEPNEDGGAIIHDVFVEHPEGDWVSYDDYAVLFAKWVGAEKIAASRKQELDKIAIL
jgi:hypothetical protein